MKELCLVNVKMLYVQLILKHNWHLHVHMKVNGIIVVNIAAVMKPPPRHFYFFWGGGSSEYYIIAAMVKMTQLYIYECGDTLG